MTVSAAILARNLADVRARIAEARLKRPPQAGEVRLIAVTKSAPVEWIRLLTELGQLDLAENRPQQLMQRATELSGSVRWHMIGHLQRNKVDSLWTTVDCIHSVDSSRLLQAIVQQVAKSAVCPRLLLEVNVSGEASKSGFAPAELLSHWDDILAQAELPIVGLMTMAPLTDDPEDVRPVFRGLRELRDRLAERSAGKLLLPELSMGMSGDYAVAVEEGATMVRVGSRLFEGMN